MKSKMAILVASPGGHIDELFELAPRIREVGEHRIWLTAPTPQTRSLLAGEDVLWVPPVSSRQGLRAVRSLPTAAATMRRIRPRLLVSTGAALAVPYLMTGSATGTPTHYIESATRRSAPSVTGRMLEVLPGVRLHHQSFSVPRRRWAGTGNVFDGFRSEPVTTAHPASALVSLGSERFPLHRAVEALRTGLPTDAEVVWQTGHTRALDLPGVARAWFSGSEMTTAARRADVIVTHAGVGSVLLALRAGRHPLIFPRLASLGEHVDDHQVELATMLDQRGLATAAPPGAITDGEIEELLSRCASRRVIRINPEPLSLEP